MEVLEIVEKFGVPITVAIAFGYFIWKQNKYIQDDLTKDLKEQFSRLEGIIVKLIDQQKKMQVEQKGITSTYKTLVDIVTRLLNKKDGK